MHIPFTKTLSLDVTLGDHVAEHPDQARHHAVGLRHGDAVHQRADARPRRADAQSVVKQGITLKSALDIR